MSKINKRGLISLTAAGNQPNYSMTHSKVKIVYLQSSDCLNRLHLILQYQTSDIFLIWAHLVSDWKHVASSVYSGIVLRYDYCLLTYTHVLFFTELWG